MAHSHPCDGNGVCQPSSDIHTDGHRNCHGRTDATLTPTPSPTPKPAKEWNLEGVLVDGFTGEVLLRVYAGIDVRVTLDGMGPDQKSFLPKSWSSFFIMWLPISTLFRWKM